jgi:hypothetical protein
MHRGVQQNDSFLNRHFRVDLRRREVADSTAQLRVSVCKRGYHRVLVQAATTAHAGVMGLSVNSSSIDKTCGVTRHPEASALYQASRQPGHRKLK